MEFDNTNRGAMFVNEKKEKDTHPDRRGSLNVNGVDHWIDGWIKTDKNGKQFMSLSVKPKEQQQAKPVSRPSPKGISTADNFDDSDIPF